MDKAVLSFILGIMGFISSAFIGPASLFFSIPGLIFSIIALKSPSKEIDLPFGIRIGGKKKQVAKPFISNKYVAWIALALNIIALFIGLSALLLIVSMAVIGIKY